MARDGHSEARHAKLPPIYSITLAALTALVAIAVFLLLAQLGFPKGERCFLPARYTTAGTPTDTFVDPDDLEDGTWTSIDSVTYRDGEESTRIHIERPILAPYAMTVTSRDGSTTYLLGGNDGRNGGDYSDYRVSASDTGIFARSFADYRDDFVRGARIDTRASTHLEHMVLFSPAPDGSEDMSLALSVTYEDTDDYHVASMEAMTDPESDHEVTVTRTFAPYEGKRFTEAVDTDSAGNVLRHITNTDEGDRSTTEVRGADGALISTQETTYDWLGRIRTRTVYDRTGQLVSEETFHYRVWERFASLTGLAFAIVFAGASLTIAFELRSSLARAILRKLDERSDG